MVNLREINRFRPSDRQPGINNEGRGGIEQFFRDAGSALTNTGSKFKRYQEASNKDQGFFRAPNQYDADMARFTGNAVAGSGEFIGDMLQLPYEAAGQAIGLDVGSGQGFGDIPYFFGQTGLSPNQEENQRLQTESLNEAYGNFPDFTTSTSLINDPLFKDYLQNVKGYNVGENFGPNEFYNMVIEPNIPTLEQFEQNSLFDKNSYSSNEEYENYLNNQYQKSIIPQENKLYSELVEPFREYSIENSVSNLAEQLGISDQLANSLLMGEGANYDLGLLNDAFADDAYRPFDYATEEGEEFFNDSIMQGAGDLAGFAKLQGLVNNVLRSGNKIRKTVGQVYPMASKMDTSIPLNYNPFKANVGTFKKSLRIPGISSPLVRSGAQTYGLMSLADQAGFGTDDYGRRYMKD